MILEFFTEHPKYSRFWTSDWTYRSLKTGLPADVYGAYIGPETDVFRTSARAGMDVRRMADGRPVVAWDAVYSHKCDCAVCLFTTRLLKRSYHKAVYHQAVPLYGTCNVRVSTPFAKQTLKDLFVIHWTGKKIISALIIVVYYKTSNKCLRCVFKKRSCLTNPSFSSPQLKIRNKLPGARSFSQASRRPRYN